MERHGRTKKLVRTKRTVEKKIEEQVAETKKHNIVKPENRNSNILEKSEGSGRSAREISATGERKTG